MIEGRLVTCRAYLKGESLKHLQVDKSSKKLYISSLPVETQNADITEAFSKFGNIESGYTLKEADSDLSKGFGFVTFETKEAADLAIEANGKLTILGKVIEITPFANMASVKNCLDEKVLNTYSTDSPSGSDNSPNHLIELETKSKLAQKSLNGEEGMELKSVLKSSVLLTNKCNCHKNELIRIPQISK